MENNNAVYPRIIISKDDFYEGYIQNPTDLENIYFIDDDEFIVIDYIKHLSDVNDTGFKNTIDYLKHHADGVLSKNIDNRIREKYLWLNKRLILLSNI